MAPLVGDDPPGEADVVFEQIVHLRAEYRRMDRGGKLAIELDAPVIEVGRSDDREPPVDAKRLGMQDRVLSLIDLGAGGKEGFVESSGGDQKRTNVGAARQHEPHADATTSGSAQLSDERVGRGEVRHRHVDGRAGVAEESLQCRDKPASGRRDGCQYTHRIFSDVQGGPMRAQLTWPRRPACGLLFKKTAA